MAFSKPKMPKPPPIITGETSEQAVGARARLRRRISGMYGRQSTLLTGSGTRAPTTTPKTLLGG